MMDEEITPTGVVGGHILNTGAVPRIKRQEKKRGGCGKNE
jgi:hypothetical protein